MDGYGLGYIYIFFSDFGRATDIMFLVGWLPDPPDQINIHIKNKIKPLSPSLSLSHLVFSLSLLSYSVTTSLAHPLFLPPSLSAFSLSFIVTSSIKAAAVQPLLHRHGLSSLFSLSTFAWGRTHRHRVVPDQVRLHWIWWDLARSSEILLDLASSSLDFG